MGKDLKNKELGKGISQRKDGKYSARFSNRAGRRVEKYFDLLRDAREWLEKAKYEDSNCTVYPPFDTVAEDIVKNDSTLPAFSDMTVDEWYRFWMNNIIPDLAWNTRRNYRERYEFNVRPVMGSLKIREVRPLHCKKVFIDMEDDYAGSTIRQTYIQMGTMFKSALMNGVITKHPMDGVKYTKAVKRKDDIRVLSVEEQRLFLETAKRSHNFDQYAFLLETGLRTGELIGLTWDAIDFDKKTVTINKTLEFRHSMGEWVAHSPKTKASYRTIPLTERAYKILIRQYCRRKTRYESDKLNLVLQFTDRLDGSIRYLNMKDLVFVNSRTGMPAKNSSYNTHLYKLCDEAGIERFCMHALRHTYATRAIERGVNPKALQYLLGHASLQVTMDTYVHVTDDFKLLAVRQFEGKTLEGAANE